MAGEIDDACTRRNPLFARRGLLLWTQGPGWDIQPSMRDPDRKPDPAKPRKPAAEMTREDRLKAALKANMARRKAQAKARAAGTADDDNENK